MNPPPQPVRKLQYAPAQARPHPWLKALVIIAGAIGVFPLTIGCMLLLYALGGMEGSREALRFGIAFVVGGIAWLAGARWLYRSLTPRIPPAGDPIGRLPEPDPRRT